MKLSYIFIVLISAANGGIMKRQIDEVGSGNIISPASRICYNGKNDNYTQQTCAKSEQMCMTKVQFNNGITTVGKSCKQPHTCTLHESENASQCNGFEALNNKVSICHFCCVGNLCNELNTIVELEATYKVLERIRVVSRRDD